MYQYLPDSPPAIQLVYHPEKSPGPPTYIVIHSNVYKIHYSDYEPKDLFKEAIERHVIKVYALTNCVNRTVQISPAQTLSDLKNTLWHEANHVANNCAGHEDFTHFFDYDDLYFTQVPQQLSLIQENPNLMDFIR